MSEAELKNITHSHPIHIADLFTLNASNPTNIRVNYNVEGLSKLLLFNAYAKSKSENLADFVMEEAKKYGYILKKESEVRKING